MPYNNSFFPARFLTALFTVVILASGCAIKQTSPPPKPSPKATRFLDQLAQSSRSFQTIKGIGRFSILTEEKSLSGRMAWIAQRPNRLRLTILDPAGRPATLLATDGETVWLDQRAEDKQYVKDARRFSIKRLVGIDVALKDVIQVLLGEIPIRSYHRIKIDASEKGGMARFLSPSGGPVTILNYQEAPFFVTRADYFDRAPALFLRLVRRKGSLAVLPLYPKELGFEDEVQNRFYLRVDHSWVNLSVDPDLFQLDKINTLPPENSELW